MTHVAMTSHSIIDRWVPDFVYAFSDGHDQAQAFAQKCGAQLGQCIIHHFPDGETLVTAAPAMPLAGRTVALYRSLHQPNEKIVELLLAADAIRSLGATKLILIAPYLPYMRQDCAFKPGQSVSQRAIGELLAHSFDGLVTIQPHLHRASSLSAVFGNKPALDLNAGPIIAAHMKADGHARAVVVGPDEESEDLIRGVVDNLGSTWFLARKVRRGDTDVEIELPADLELRNQPVVIVDDIISSGGTIITLAQALKKAGAGDISVYVVHAMFDQHAAVCMQRAGVAAIKSLNTIPHKTNAIDVVALLCTAIGVP